MRKKTFMNNNNLFITTISSNKEPYIFQICYLCKSFPKTLTVLIYDSFFFYLQKFELFSNYSSISANFRNLCLNISGSFSVFKNHN